jgi:hypothetical protein
MCFVGVWLATYLSASFKLPLWYVGTNTPSPEMAAERRRVIALVGIEFKDSALGSDSQFGDGCFGTDTVVPVAFDRHVGTWESILFGQE